MLPLRINAVKPGQSPARVIPPHKRALISACAGELSGRTDQAPLLPSRTGGYDPYWRIVHPGAATLVLFLREYVDSQRSLVLVQK